MKYSTIVSRCLFVNVILHKSVYDKVITEKAVGELNKGDFNWLLGDLRQRLCR